MAAPAVRCQHYAGGVPDHQGRQRQAAAGRYTARGPLDKALDLLPELINKVTAMIDQKKAEKKEAKSNQENPSKEK